MLRKGLGAGDGIKEGLPPLLFLDIRAGCGSSGLAEVLAPLLVELSDGLEVIDRLFDLDGLPRDLPILCFLIGKLLEHGIRVEFLADQCREFECRCLENLQRLLHLWRQHLLQAKLLNLLERLSRHGRDYSRETGKVSGVECLRKGSAETRWPNQNSVFHFSFLNPHLA